MHLFNLIQFKTKLQSKVIDSWTNHGQTILQIGIRNNNEMKVPKHILKWGQSKIQMEPIRLFGLLKLNEWVYRKQYVPFAQRLCHAKGQIVAPSKVEVQYSMKN